MAGIVSGIFWLLKSMKRRGDATSIFIYTSNVNIHSTDIIIYSIDWWCSTSGNKISATLLNTNTAKPMNGATENTVSISTVVFQINKAIQKPLQKTIYISTSLIKASQRCGHACGLYLHVCGQKVKISDLPSGDSPMGLSVSVSSKTISSSSLRSVLPGGLSSDSHTSFLSVG